MKVYFDLNREKAKVKSVPSFQGFKFDKSDMGAREFVVNCPYDSDKHDCYLEVYKLRKDAYGNYISAGRAQTKDGHDAYKLSSEENRIDLSRTFGISDNVPFAFHYVLKDKGTDNFSRVYVDCGDMIDERKTYCDNYHLFNIVMPNRSNVSRGGSMKLVIIDSQNVGKVYNDQNIIIDDPNLKQRGINTVKTLNNKFGGTLAGMECAIDKGEYDAYDKIISLPLFTDDDFSAAGYWNSNCYQMINSLGNINNYASFQRKMFSHGLNFVSDGAFVNEGLQGVHFKHLIKWGEDSPYKHWFKASSLADGPLSLGIFVKNKDFISHKVVNHPRIYTQDLSGRISSRSNPEYDSKKPTYIQYFDKRLASEKEIKDAKNLIVDYEKSNLDNPYALHTHNDSVHLYSIDIKPEIYDKNIKLIDQYNRKHKKDNNILLDGPAAARLVSKSIHHVTDGKFESGFENWDANPDIAKLNFSFSNVDAKTLLNIPEKYRAREAGNIKRGNYQVQDYTVEAGKYWTRKTNDIHRLYVAQMLRGNYSGNPSLAYDDVISYADNKHLPLAVKTKVSKAEVENVVDGFYLSSRKLSNEDKKSQILESLMSLPLDSIEFADNVVAVLGSPLISKRASVAEDVGVSRYELFKAGDKNLPSEYAKTYNAMNDIYTNEMSDFAMKALEQVDKLLPESKKLFQDGEVTEFGKYAIQLVGPEIAKFAIVKSLRPKTLVAISHANGELSYNYKELKNTHLQTLGISNATSPNDEATKLLNKIAKGIPNIDTSEKSVIVESLYRTLKDTSLESFKLADLIIDKTQSGLDWRIDATKDIADIEALRNGDTSFEYTWDYIIDFWKKFTQGVLSQNPNSYIVAEVTDEKDLYNIGQGWLSKKYAFPRDIITKFLRETGITSIANYSYFFSTVSNLFTRSFETGDVAGQDYDYVEKLLHQQMIGKKNEADSIPFVRSGMLDSLIYSYTFVGNHDKPRALHCCALDMGMFYADLQNPDNFQYRERAFRYVNDRFFGDISANDINSFDYSHVSPKAVAMADTVRAACINQLDSIGSELTQQQYEQAFIAISKSVCDLVNGRYMGRRFDPEAFGSKPIDVAISTVMKLAKDKYGLPMDEKKAANFENESFKRVMIPAINKLKAMMKFLVALPGLPTLYDGDDVGSTGWDSKTKNMTLQGRQRVHDEWLEIDGEKYKSFILENKKDFDKIMSLRKNPNCGALNNGAIYPLVLQTAHGDRNVPAVFRHNTDGKMAVSLFNTNSLKLDYDKEYYPYTLTINRIYLNEMDELMGIPGLKENLCFRNANDENDVYKTKIDEKGQYYIQRMNGNTPIATEIKDSTLVLYHVPEDADNNKVAAVLSAAQAMKAYQLKSEKELRQIAIK